MEKLKRSFSIVHNDEDFFSEEASNDVENLKLNTKFSDSEPEEEEDVSELRSPNKKAPLQALISKPEAVPRKKKSAELNNKPSLVEDLKLLHSSDSDEISEIEKINKKLPGEYNPTEFADLKVDDEIAEIFEYITIYTPPKITMEFKFKPFIPEFLPAVGDVDAFLKVVPPEVTLCGNNFDENLLKLGLLMLDEPAANQSDPALLHLQLRAANNDGINEEKNILVKKIDNIEKNAKVIEKWIKDVSDLHKTKSSPIVRYSQAMPEIDDLMQQWPEDLEQKFKNEGFPKPNENQSLHEYINTVCNYFQIPMVKNPIQSLHLLFCLYAAIKQTQLYQIVKSPSSSSIVKNNNSNDADQLLLE